MIRKLLTAIVLLAICSLTTAQNMEQWWINMPDSLLGYMNKSKRIEAMDYQNMGLKIDVTNLMKGSTIVDTLTSDFIEVRLNEATIMQMRLLPKDSDTIVCVIKTMFAPEAESLVCYYDRSWQRIGVETLDTIIDKFIHRPDTMSVAHYSDLCKMIEPIMVKSTLSISDNTMVKELSLPMLTKEEKASVKAVLKQRKFKWADGKFIEC